MSDTADEIILLRQSVNALTASNSERMSTIESRVQAGSAATVAQVNQTALQVQQTAQVVAAQSNLEFSESTWVALQTKTGSASGKGASVRGDAGTHVDPVKTGSVTVPNQGVYTWRGAAWEWMGPLPVAQADFDKLAGPIPAGTPQLYETISTKLDGRAVIMSPAKRIMGIFPDPGLDLLKTQAVTVVDPVYESLSIGKYPETWIRGSNGKIMARLADAAAVTQIEAKTTSLTATAMTVTNPVYESLTISGPPETWIRNPSGKIIARLGDASTLSAVVAKADQLAANAVSVVSYETLSSAGMYLRGAGGKILAQIGSDEALASKVNTNTTELATSAGSNASLHARLDHGLTPYGDPIGPFAGKWSIRGMRMRLQQLDLGEVAQAIVILIGDSYTQNDLRYAGPLAKALQNKYGSAGVGYYSLTWYGTAAGTWTTGNQPTGKDACARSDLLTVQQVVGTWTCSYIDPANATPTMSKITSSTADDYVRLSVLANHNAAQLFYAAGDGTGVVAVSWDDGVTYGQSIALTATTGGNIALPGIPATATTMRLKVVSGTVALGGIDFQSAAKGVRIHKLGASGSRAAQWAAMNGPLWAASIAALNPTLVSLLFGTNDQSISTPTTTFTSNLSTIFSRVPAYVDRLVVMPAENQRTTITIPMTAYASAARSWSLANDVAFADTQYAFGSPDNFAYAYAWANPVRPWYASDLIHPVPETGGRVITNVFVSILTQL